MKSKYTVYKHTSPSGKCYVGITSKTLEERWGENGRRYLYKVNNHYKHAYFASAILKYGWNNFKHEIILENIGELEAKYAEKYLIKWYKLHRLSYNLTDGGDGTCGYTMSKEVVERIKLSHIGLKQSPETIAKRVSKVKGKKRTDAQKMKRSKTVYQFSLDGKFLASYFGVNEASRQTLISKTHIASCCNLSKNRKSAGGYLWSYENKAPIYHKDHADRKQILQFYDGKLIKQWPSMKDVIRDYKISRYLLQKACKTGLPDNNGFIWKWGKI